VDIAKGFKKTLATLALASALSFPVSALPNKDTNQEIQGPSLALGLSSPSHGVLALRGVYEFNDHVGIQADIGIGLTGVDFRYGERRAPWINTYGYIGFIGVSPWIYLLNNSKPNGPIFAAEAGAGLEMGRRIQGLSFGIEGGLVLPIPSVPDTGAFRVDLNLTYRFPIKKK
jgi:hypothetical protein